MVRVHMVVRDVRPARQLGVGNAMGVVDSEDAEASPFLPRLERGAERADDSAKLDADDRRRARLGHTGDASCVDDLDLSVGVIEAGVPQQALDMWPGVRDSMQQVRKGP